jgi:hypothetical protein
VGEDEVLQLGAAVKPAVVHALGQGQGSQVLMLAAPLAALKRPAGQRVKFREDWGQKAPCGHSSGTPAAQ